MKIHSLICLLLIVCLDTFSANRFVVFEKESNAFSLVSDNKIINILIDKEDQRGIHIAVDNLCEDFSQVFGMEPQLTTEISDENCIIVGSLNSKYIKQLIQKEKLEKKQLQEKNEKYIITTVDAPFNGVKKALVIAGSDRRGTIYGIYELSKQLGVSPWYWWMDVPVVKRAEAYILPGIYTDGEPAVKYRGIFLNDEAPCLTSWVKQYYGTDFGDHRFYAQVCELILRLKGNFLWPAMWGWAFYADDSLNSKTADEMGVIIGTSHHEPMARNHQEWARKRNEYGAWNYSTNKKVLDQFFREGIERVKNTEDIITIGMRGDGDEAMSEDTNVKLMESIVENQRRIIEDVTGKPAKETPQVWALYKEVLDYYDKGMRVPEDVIMLLCDDNWGNVRRLPDLKDKRHPGGYGMYYHVDLHGAPRAYQWLNMTQIQHMWEQLYLTYSYGVDKMWILNVGDLKPNEFPVDFFLNMAWNPGHLTADNLQEYTCSFCKQQFGDNYAVEAARILNLYCKYAARVTAEMLDSQTYNLSSGEFKAVTDEFLALEAHAYRQFMTLPEELKDTYKELILFPVQAMANLYEMYYAVAMNHKLASAGDPRANEWADRVEYCFRYDAELCYDYNNNIAGGKWNHLMDQTHIGYTSWDEPKGGNIMPEIIRVDVSAYKPGGYEYKEKGGVVVMEAERFAECTQGNKTEWTVIPDLGRTLSGLSLMPYTQPVTGASLTYRMKLNSEMKNIRVRLILDSTLPFIKGGHSYAISLDGGKEQIVNYNSEMTWANCYTKMYPAGAARLIESVVDFSNVNLKEGIHALIIRPLSPAIVLHKIIIDCGSDEVSRLNLQESPYRKVTH